jgi:hypothetical protein
MGEYWERKNAELALLARAAGVPAPRVEDGAALFPEKQRLRAALLARAISADPTLTESAFDGAHRGGRFRYTYQRLDLRMRTRSFFDEVYALDRRRGPAFGLWGGSGMGTITALLRALDFGSGRPRRLLYPEDVYFEVRAVLPLLNNLLPNTDDDAFLDGDVFLLDSVTAEDHFPLLQKPLQPLHLVLFDTTCYDAGSALIDRVIARCCDERVPLVLLRSHLKLDCMGTEYARLGSAVFWLPPKPSPSLVARLRILHNHFFDELRRAGATALPTALWPLAGDAEFRRLNSERNRGMVAAQLRAGAALSSRLPRMRITTPHHGCFLMFEPPRNREHQLIADRAQLVARLRAAGIPAVFAPSFGYDIVAMTLLQQKIRVAIPDLPDEAVDRLVDVVAGYWHMYM